MAKGGDVATCCSSRCPAAMLRCHASRSRRSRNWASTATSSRGSVGDRSRTTMLARRPHTNRRPTPVSRCATRYPTRRSEEHTSELQSRFDLVCRLLLEKKKNNITYLGFCHSLFELLHPFRQFRAFVNRVGRFRA